MVVKGYIVRAEMLDEFRSVDNLDHAHSATGWEVIRAVPRLNWALYPRAPSLPIL